MKNGNLLVGDHQMLYCYDHLQNKILSTLQISNDPDEAIYDIYLMPDDLALPPISFRNTIKIMQTRQREMDSMDNNRNAKPIILCFGADGMAVITSAINYYYSPLPP